MPKLASNPIFQASPSERYLRAIEDDRIRRDEAAKTFGRFGGNAAIEAAEIFSRAASLQNFSRRAKQDPAKGN